MNMDKEEKVVTYINNNTMALNVRMTLVHKIHFFASNSFLPNVKKMNCVIFSVANMKHYDKDPVLKTQNYSDLVLFYA